MIVIVDYGLGNLFSVQKAFEALGALVVVSSDPEVVRTAERLVLPGVGAFGDGMRNLKERNLLSVLEEAVLQRKIPILGICLGMQLLANRGTEYGDHTGLGWIGGVVEKIDVSAQGLKVPHIGWNQIAIQKEHSLFQGIKEGSDFYFVHSYEFRPMNPADILATAYYGAEITAAICKNNMVGVQFHPEKSQDSGLKLLENFIHWKP